jgi:hypothetical protein
VDDTVMEKLDGYTIAETKAYIDSQKALVSFLKNYRPKNFKMTITPSSTQFKSEKEFWKIINKNIERIKDDLPPIDDVMAKRIHMSVRLGDGEKQNEKSRQETYQLLNAYLYTVDSLDYYNKREDKIIAFVQRDPFIEVVAVGTTKNSIMKHWIGVGVLRRKNDTFEPTILSFNQIQGRKFDVQKALIPGLTGKNFKKIRILE